MNVDARRKRSPVGPKGLRLRAFHCRTSRVARVRFGFSLVLAFGATAALGAAATFVENRPGGYYIEGEVIGITVTFDEPEVTVTGTPTFSLTVGRRTRTMAYDAENSASNTMRFNYTVVDGDADDDGVSYGSNALRGGRIVSGNPPAPVDRTVTAIARDRDQRVDAKKPRVDSVRLTSNPGSDRAYRIDDPVLVSVTFDELVTTSDAALALTVGTESRDMELTGTGERQTLVFRYTVVEDDEDANGVSVATNALTGTIEDAAGNPATLTLPRVTDQSGHAVDGVPPANPSLRIVSSPRGGGIYRRGESILVELRFAEAVRVSGQPTLTLQVGTREAPARYDAGRSGGRAVVFSHEVLDHDSDEDGISVEEDAVTPDAIRDSAGNLWDNMHSALAEQRSHRVDGSLPTVRVTSVDIDPDGPYGIGDSITLEVHFSGRVHDADETLKFRLRVGNTTKEMDFVDGNGGETLRFTYSVMEGDQDEDGVGYAANALVGTGRLVDGHDWPVDRTVKAVARLSDQLVDGIRPSPLAEEPIKERSTPRNDGTYAAGESIEVAVLFDEPVKADHSLDLLLALRIGTNVREAVLVGGDGTDALVFRYTVQDGDQGDSVSITGLAGGTVVDLAENPAENLLRIDGTLDRKVDGVAPTVPRLEIVSDPGEDDTYAAGDRIEIEVNFDERVKVFGRPILLVSIGEPTADATNPTANLTRRATLERTRPQVLFFAYTVQPGDLDKDGISIGSEALQGGTITDAAGNPIVRAFGERESGPRKNHTVDAVEPSVVGVEITSNPNNDQFYVAEERIDVQVTFSEFVYVHPPASSLALDIAIGAVSRRAGYVDGSGTATLRFRYEVQVGDRDEDGISIGPDALRLGDNPEAVTDGAGNPPEGGTTTVPRQPGHKVGAAGVPAVTSVSILDPPGGEFNAGDRIEALVEFDRVVHVTGAPALTLSIGARNRAASFAGGSGTRTLRFGYTVVAADRDDDGVSVPANALSEGLIADDAGNVADRRFRAVPPDSRWTVDGSVVGDVNASLEITSDPEDGMWYGLGENIEIELHFHTPGNPTDSVRVHATGDPVLLLEIGGGTVNAALVSGSGTDALTFRYTVRAGDYDNDGISIGPNALSGGTIVTATGEAVDRRFAPLRANQTHKVDAVEPSVFGVEITSDPGTDDTYVAGDAITVEVTFDEVVHVTSAGGELSLMLSIGENLRAATFFRGSGTGMLQFRYFVRAGDADDDGISIGPNALRGGTIQDVAGNAADRSLDGRGPYAGHEVDAVEPSVFGVEITSDAGPDDTYVAGDAITLEVTFDEVVHVTSGGGELSLMLSIGQHLRAATFFRGSGTRMLEFRYFVQVGDADDDGISIGPNALRGGTIQDVAGNAVDRGFEGSGPYEEHMVIGLPAPRVAAERPIIVSDAGSNRTYTTDDEIRIHVRFNAPVYVTGDPPVLKLAVGSMLKDAIFQEGSGSRTLKFQYTVEAGDIDEDGISIGPNALIGTIEDRAGNPVDLALPPLLAQPNHKVSAELRLFPLSLTLEVGEQQSVNLADVLRDLDVPYRGNFHPPSSDDDSIATASLAGRSLTVAAVTEGAAVITVAATDAAIFLVFGVTVETSAEETAVLEDALAAVGRGLIASAGSTIGARLESDENKGDVWGGLRAAPSVSVAPWSQRSVLDGSGHWGDPLGHGYPGIEDPYLRDSMRYTAARWLRGARFEMPFRGPGNSARSWSVWGAGDWHAFEGKPDDGLYDGSLTSVYLGVDVRDDRWVSGAAVSRAMADATYAFGPEGQRQKGRLQTELNVIHPYAQWSFDDRGKAWAILGFGDGEATAERDGQDASKASSDLTMLMGLGGMRYAFGPWARFDFVLKGDAGFANLGTDEGPRAIEGLAVNVQRLRAGAEASLPMAFGGIPVTPFIDIAGRYDHGHGATGGGMELAGGFRYRSPLVGLEVKGRALTMHSAESYSEHGVKATLLVGPDGRTGFRLLLSPRWGGTAEAMDIFRHRGHPFGALGRDHRGWGLGTRISYGFDMRRRPGTIMPFGEMDLSRDGHRRARLGLSYELASAVQGLPHRLEIFGEGAESDLHGTILRFLLSGRAHF